MARIYLSSSFRDLEPQRAAVLTRLRAAGHATMAMEHYPASAGCPTGRCQTDAQTCDVYVGLFARRYGFVPPDRMIAITEIEYRHALAAERPMAILLLSDEADWPVEWSDRHTGEGAGGQRIERLRRELVARHPVRHFTTSADVVGGVASALTTLGA